MRPGGGEEAQLWKRVSSHLTHGQRHCVHTFVHSRCQMSLCFPPLSPRCQNQQLHLRDKNLGSTLKDSRGRCSRMGLKQEQPEGRGGFEKEKVGEELGYNIDSSDSNAADVV